jgi:hypothetical protein
MGETLRIGFEIGPRLVKVEVPSCYGCPALRRTTWTDAKGEHVTARCSALLSDVDGEPAIISTWWRPDRHPPSWCPGDPDRVPYNYGIERFADG